MDGGGNGRTCLEKQIGKTVEAYVDDVVIKTRHVESLIDDLRLTFDNLRTYDIKLNPEKCVFGVPAGKLLGLIVSNRGIEANPAKIQALSQLATSTDLKQVQKLAGCVAALSRFISRLGEKALPLYRLLRRTDHFEWTEAATAGLVSHSTTCARMTLSSIRKSVFSASPPEKCWASSFQIEELRQIHPKSKLCHNWLCQQTLNRSKNSRDAWQL